MSLIKPNDCYFCGSECGIEQSADWHGVYCSNRSCFMNVPELPSVDVWNNAKINNPKE